MPLAVDRLTPDSSKEAIDRAISESISQCMHEGGRKVAQCEAIAFSKARKATGKRLK